MLSLFQDEKLAIATSKENIVNIYLPWQRALALAYMAQSAANTERNSQKVFVSSLSSNNGAIWNRRLELA